MGPLGPPRTLRQLHDQDVDLAGQLRVGLQLQFLLDEIVVGFACWKAAGRFWPIITKMDKKI